ncbi:molybdopterin-synthase adenylyltransferase MoeB [Emticicia sp. BO119]|uniref:molybdopterin-synthase adenylyltransferase MoeB n=1 Tax=Emticicia sp. BO119 TaxID=2757768 RepID=UPI0015F0A6BA|nr:molybdopterin-synthase adenylyltransferase MoeB [Emticicia sp. BO119]MBA4853186.1 molybdopterin-synthase adenylyltransferase MoeB [Emticicia sp. BO119]
MALSLEEIRRYDRQILLPELGLQGQQKLKQAKVLVIGCGGLGSPVLLYLAAAGVGTLGIVEDDRISLSNLQRQILYSSDKIGKPKIDEAEKKLKALNPLVTIAKHEVRLSADNALALIQKYDLVIDGTDNFPTRYLVNDACVILDKPFVYGAIHRFEGQVALFNYKGSSTYRDLFPAPPPPEQAPNCSEAGVLGVLPGIIGSMQALEAIKAITAIGEPLAGKLLMLDTLTMQSRTLKVPKIPDSPSIENLIDYEAFCGIRLNDEFQDNEITYEQYLDLIAKPKINGESPFQLIDVREEYEFEMHNIGGELMPLSEIEKHIPKIRRDKTVVIHCQSGIRSQRAIDLLQERFGYTNLLNFAGGLNAISDTL